MDIMYRSLARRGSRHRATQLRWLVCVLLLWAHGAVSADPNEVPGVGDNAPDISASTWLNTEAGENPLDGDVDPKLILIEFWGTWCGPCVRSMPKIQAMWEKYREHGLLVLAITREHVGEVRGFLKENNYTMPVGCDPSETCIGAFKPDGWPTSILVDRDLKIVWRGSPYGVEVEITKALGIETDVRSLLRAWLDADHADKRDKAACRSALEALLARAPADFDLRAFAETVLGAPAPEDAKEAPLRGKKAAKQLDLLRKAWPKADRRKALLARWAAAESDRVDLRAWVSAVFRKAYPFKSSELKKLLAQAKYGAVVDMFVALKPSAGIYKLGAKNEGLVAYCDGKAKEAWTLSRKAKMGHMYWMSDGGPPADFDSEAFSRDISISGMMMNNERNRVVGLLIGGDRVTKAGANAYALRQLGRSVVMNAISAGQGFSPAKLEQKVTAEMAKIVKALRKKYG